MNAQKRRTLGAAKSSAERFRIAKLKRNTAIVAALEHSTTREVGEAAGLSPARIHQIRHSK